MHSPLAEVAICMSIYAMIPLALENIPPCWSGSGTLILACGLESNDSSDGCIHSFPGSLPPPTCCRGCTNRRWAR
jgi:hypothetical protein